MKRIGRTEAHLFITLGFMVYERCGWRGGNDPPHRRKMMVRPKWWRFEEQLKEQRYRSWLMVVQACQVPRLDNRTSIIVGVREARRRRLQEFQHTNYGARRLRNRAALGKRFLKYSQWLDETDDVFGGPLSLYYMEENE